MLTSLRLLWYQLEDVRRSRGVLAFTLVLLGTTELLVRFGGGGPRVALSLMSVVLLPLPLVSLLFGTVYLYNSRDFVELLLAQPVTRSRLFSALYLGLALPLAAGLAAGVLLPLAWHSALDAETAGAIGTLVGAGVLLVFAFTSIAFLLAVSIEDRARGMGAAVLVWLLATLLYDGAVLAGIAAFDEYPLEAPLIAVSLLNPVDLARVLLLLQLDTAALLGYTGAVFERFFGTAQGVAVSLAALAVWAVVPWALARRRFARKDF
ncbi:MAG TPA: ABC transporter permease subunit [Gemmatimonadales bacterium]|nr:ABC transporter permease subunit [Gemmatimonadales bacterium]